MILNDLILQDINQEFTGWDFSYLNQSSRMVEFPLTWNYTIEILKHIKNVNSLLDMGTGGGEFLKTLPLPTLTYATEGYKPNIKIAKEFLEPLGVKVFSVFDDNHLPFNNNLFDLVINRHESYSPIEVKRIIKDKGIFITQQVGGLNDQELNEYLKAEKSEYYDWNLKKATDELISHGFNIIQHKEDITKTRFYDIGAICYYLKAIPWQIPNFSIQKYQNELINIHNFIEKEGYIDITCHRFLIIAQKL